MPAVPQSEASNLISHLLGLKCSVGVAHGEATGLGDLVSVLVKIYGLSRCSAERHPWGATNSVRALLLLCSGRLRLLRSSLLSPGLIRHTLA